jgi:hypothetical protein
MLGSSPAATAAATSFLATSMCPGLAVSSTQCAVGRRGLKRARGPRRVARQDCSSPDRAVVCVFRGGLVLDGVHACMHACVMASSALYLSIVTPTVKDRPVALSPVDRQRVEHHGGLHLVGRELSVYAAKECVVVFVGCIIN